MTTVRERFMDPITRKVCELVMPDDGAIFPMEGEAKIGVAHPDCPEIADLSIDLDCFYCQVCRHNGRVSGAWCVDLIRAAYNDVCPECEGTGFADAAHSDTALDGRHLPTSCPTCGGVGLVPTAGQRRDE